MAVFITKDGQRVNVSDFELEQNPKLAENLTPAGTDSASQQILTGVETGAATVANLGSAASQFAGGVDAMGNPTETVAPVAPESLVPGAFTPEALQRRSDNPLAALAGTVAVEAPTLLIPGAGEGWAARLGIAAARGAASGAIAEAGQDALTGETFSAKHAAFYGLIGESLGALASAGLGRLVRMTGKAAPSALEVATLKASRADMADALGEPAESALKAAKMADAAPELIDQAVTDLGEHLTAIDAKLSKAEENAFSMASIKRNVSSNTVAQSENLMSRGIELEQVAKRLATDGLDVVPPPDPLPVTQMGTPLDYRPPTAAETQKEAADRVLGEIRRKLGSENIEAVNESQVGVRGRKGLGTRSSETQKAKIDAMSPESRLEFRSNLEDQAAQARRTPFHSTADDTAPSLYRRKVESSGSFADKLQAATDELLSKRTSADMYGTLRKLTAELHDAAPPNLPDYARAALGALDDSLADEPTWGNVAKLAAESRVNQAARGGFAADALADVSSRRAKIAELFKDGADRTQFNAYLDSAEAAAKTSVAKGLRKSVDAARAALATGDDASTSKLLRDTFSEKAPDLAGRLAGKVVRGVIKGGLGAVGLHGGLAGGMAGMALGEAVAPFFEQAAARFTTEGVAPVLRKLSQSAQTQVATAGRALSNGALRSSMSTIGSLGAPTMSAGIAGFMGSHDSIRSAYNEKIGVLQDIKRDPSLLVGELDDSIGALAATHPELHAEIVVKHFQALNYLQTKIPETVGVSLTSPSGVPPSSIAIRQFALYHSGATDPASVVTDVRNNRVRQEQLESLRTVWPEVYNDLKQSTLAGMASSRPTVQQRMRMDLLFDFGPALDAGLSWSLALVMDGETEGDARAQAARAGKGPRGRSTPATLAQQPQGLAALSNPQTEHV